MGETDYMPLGRYWLAHRGSATNNAALPLQSDTKMKTHGKRKKKSKVNTLVNRTNVGAHCLFFSPS
jgi:hypothetical protein